MRPFSRTARHTLAALFTISIASLLAAFHFYDGVSQISLEYISLSYFRSREHLPDFSQHKALVHTMEEKDWGIARGRTIIVGDLHGMIQPLRELLANVKYKPSADILIHVGDIITKGPHSGSLDVLSFMSTYNITGVRGNHDQKVIEWRAWIEWISSLPGGRKWLRSLRKDWAEAQDTRPELLRWLDNKREHSRDKKWWKRIPKGWTLLSEHFMVADDMSAEHYQYLLDLPLVLHVPSAHAFIVHAGILPSDPRRRLSHPKQPLAHVPTVPKVASNRKRDIQFLRGLQEAAVLNLVPQNNSPWGLMNMRSLSKHGEVIRDGNIGEPWHSFWNSVVSRCNGFHPAAAEVSGESGGSLPCYPSTVVYGHSAARGLDPQRWSIGLDSGCVHGRHLTALMLGKAVSNDIDQLKQVRRVPFGDKDFGYLYSIKCH